MSGMLSNNRDASGGVHFELALGAYSAMERCPGCGTTENLKLCNNWTAHYWIECESRGCRWQCSDPRPTASQSVDGHRRSSMRAIKAWNDRA